MSAHSCTRTARQSGRRDTECDDVSIRVSTRAREGRTPTRTAEGCASARLSAVSSLDFARSSCPPATKRSVAPALAILIALHALACSEPSPDLFADRAKHPTVLTIHSSSPQPYEPWPESGPFERGTAR